MNFQWDEVNKDPAIKEYLNYSSEIPYGKILKPRLVETKIKNIVENKGEKLLDSASSEKIAVLPQQQESLESPKEINAQGISQLKQPQFFNWKQVEVQAEEVLEFEESCKPADFCG